MKGMKYYLFFVYFLFSSSMLFSQKIEQEVNLFLDNWHIAAAKADAENYFGAMSIDGVFLGTDETEYWKREDFRKWAKPHFDAKKTWEFKGYDRHIYYDHPKTVWFDEKLTTWMGVCRGSGVLTKTKKGWSLRQYNLAILVPNEIVDEYLKLLKKK